MRNDHASELISKRYGIRLDVVQEWIALTKWDTGFESPLGQIQLARDYLEKLELAPISNLRTEELWLKL